MGNAMPLGSWNVFETRDMQMSQGDWEVFGADYIDKGISMDEDKVERVRNWSQEK